MPSPRARLDEVIGILTMLTQGGRIAAALLIFGLIVTIHEWGHFLAAKAMGVKVNEFAIGFGPTLFRFGKGETLYTLRLLPLGGFCAMEGEDSAGSAEVRVEDTPSDPNDPRSFLNKPVWRRLIITVAGVAANLLLGFLVLLVYNGICIRPAADGSVYYAGTQISVLEENTPSYQSGLRPGDTLLTIDGQRVFSSLDIQFLLQSSDDGIFEMNVKRGDETVTLPAVTFERTYSEETGHYVLKYDFYVNPVKQTVWSTVVESARMECSTAVTVWRTLKGMFTGVYGLNDLSGPVGTVDAIGDVVENAVQQQYWQDGLGNVLMLIAMITVNVGVFNLLPIPALDGGRLLFLIVEGITRKRVPPKYEGWVHAAGFILLLLLIAVVTFNDILKLFA